MCLLFFGSKNWKHCGCSLFSFAECFTRVVPCDCHQGIPGEAACSSSQFKDGLEKSGSSDGSHFSYEGFLWKMLGKDSFPCVCLSHQNAKFVLRIDMVPGFHHHAKFLSDLVFVFVLTFPFCEDQQTPKSFFVKVFACLMHREVHCFESKWQFC